MAEAIKVSLDGVLLDPGDARISALDDGLLRGDGAFEAIKLYEGHPFRLDQHLARLGRSAAAIELPCDAGALRRETQQLLDSEAPADEAMLRIVITRGGRRILILEELPDWPESARIALVALSPSELLAGVKSISYAANMQATRLAQARGADEAVLVDRDGTVLEAPTSSVFWVTSDGTVETPALSCGILDSVTRDVVIEALDVREGRFDSGHLIGAREAFLASTTREIQPISTVDEAELGEVPGSVTTAAGAAVRSAVEADREPSG